MKFSTSIVALLSVASLVAAVPRPVPDGDESSSAQSRGFDLSSFASMTPDAQQAYLLTLNPQNVNLTDAELQEVAQIPAVQTLLVDPSTGEQMVLTNAMVAGYLAKLQSQAEVTPAGGEDAASAASADGAPAEKRQDDDSESVSAASADDSEAPVEKRQDDDSSVATSDSSASASQGGDVASTDSNQSSDEATLSSE
ncbi:hypothetical protein HMN09_00149600 [Mycena chlorophos]|uniref:Uncharacterized protein n=1 Tax=Mycena chlorophos TaxID=658473 RepID=A0A8H6TMT6_MYCCL|nr:hypothetical protein HMN09_00149600 [Mycena chlorophos]